MHTIIELCIYLWLQLTVSSFTCNYIGCIMEESEFDEVKIGEHRRGNQE